MSAPPDIRNADIAGRTALVRADLNVPIRNGVVVGATRITRFAPAGVADRISYLSTAGGVFLEWLEGRALPGVEILRSNTKRPEEF